MNCWRHRLAEINSNEESRTPSTMFKCSKWVVWRFRGQVRARTREGFRGQVRARTREGPQGTRWCQVGRDSVELA